MRMQKVLMHSRFLGYTGRSSFVEYLWSDGSKTWKEHTILDSGGKVEIPWNTAPYIATFMPGPIMYPTYPDVADIEEES